VARDVRYAWDVDDRLRAVIDAVTGQRTEHQHDALGRLTSSRKDDAAELRIPDALGNIHVDGLFIDDFWSTFPYRLPWAGSAATDCSLTATGGPSEVRGGCIAAMGLDATDVAAIAANWSVMPPLHQLVARFPQTFARELRQSAQSLWFTL
jgi:hypothetical protein